MKRHGYIVPKWKSLEIDDEDDFLMVEALMKSRILKMNNYQEKLNQTIPGGVILILEIMISFQVTPQIGSW